MVLLLSPFSEDHQLLGLPQLPLYQPVPGSLVDGACLNGLGALVMTSPKLGMEWHLLIGHLRQSTCSLTSPGHVGPGHRAGARWCWQHVGLAQREPQAWHHGQRPPPGAAGMTASILHPPLPLHRGPHSKPRKLAECLADLPLQQGLQDVLTDWVWGKSVTDSSQVSCLISWVHGDAIYQDVTNQQDCGLGAGVRTFIWTSFLWLL